MVRRTCIMYIIIMLKWKIYELPSISLFILTEIHNSDFRWQASCYHFAESKSSRRNSKQVTRVNMHVARVSFDHRSLGYTDISDYLVFRQKSPLVKIEFSKGTYSRHLHIYYCTCHSVKNAFRFYKITLKER